MSKEMMKGNDALAMMNDDAGMGLETADRDCFAIPFLKVLQKSSGQVEEGNADYIKDAKPGMFYNTVTGELFDGKVGVTFLPCAFQRRFLRWAPRGEGSFKGELMPEDVAAMQSSGEVVHDEGALYVGTADPKKSDRLVDTRSHFGIIVGEAGASQVILALTSTQIKKSKQLLSLLSAARIKTADGLVTPPTWMNQINITTNLESNDQGSWYGVRFTAGGFIESKELYELGKSFYQIVSAGKATVNYDADKSDKF